MSTVLTFVGNGTNRLFSFDFDYIQKDFVKVTVNGAPVAFTFQNTKTVQTNVAPASGTIVTVYRDTDRNKMVTFSDGSVLLSADLNLADLQLLHISTEARDQARAGLSLTTDGSYNSNGRRISNLGVPLTDNDAVSRKYVAELAKPQADAAIAAQAEAQRNAATTVQARDAANSAAATAAAQANIAKSEADRARDLVGSAVLTGDYLVFPSRAAAEAVSVPPSIATFSIAGVPHSRKVGGYLTTADGATWDISDAQLGSVALAAPAVIVDRPTVLTVGPGGNFPTLNAALNVASRAARSSKDQRLDIRLTAGFVMEEQVRIDRIDLGFVRIASDAVAVPIRRSALTTAMYSDFPAFCAAFGGVLPNIAALFEMDDTGEAVGRSGFIIADSGRVFIEPGAGIRFCPNRGLHVANDGHAVARGTDFRGAGFAPSYVGGGCAVRNSMGYVEVRRSILTGSAIGMRLAGCSITDAEDADVSGCGLGIENIESEVRFGAGIAVGCGRFLLSQRGGNTHARNVNASGATGAGAIRLEHGSHLDAGSLNISGSAGTALSASSSSFALFGANLSGAQANAIYISGGRGDAVECDLRNAGQHGLLAENGAGKVNAQGSFATGAGTFGFMWNNGCDLNVNGTTGTYGRTLNSQSRHGIAYG